MCIFFSFSYFTLIYVLLWCVLQAALGLFGMISGPVLGLFVLGIIYPWTNYRVKQPQ